MANRPKHQLTLRAVDDQTIAAQCTPTGSGALALLRVCGSDAVVIVDRITACADGNSLTEAPSHTIHYGAVVEGNNIIDRVLFLLMRAPRTFTGQDTVEITCHNNPFIIARILDLLYLHGARPAQPGEFSRRAVLHGKLDLLQAEAINDLIHAGNPKMLEHSLAQLDGSLSNALAALEVELFALLAHVEASFEFLDEEARDLDLQQQIGSRLAAIQSNVQEILGDHDAQTMIRNGIQIALIGSVNAGKSTLFNALLGKERAIVSPQAGTTRDAIESTRHVNGMFWQLVDTAGLRTTLDSIEQQGIARSHQHAVQADIVLLVYDSSEPLDERQMMDYANLITQLGDKVLVVANKQDAWQTTKPVSSLEGFSKQPVLTVSAASKTGIADLEEAIMQRIRFLIEKNSCSFILSERQRRILLHLLEQLKLIANSHSESLSCELMACQLHDLLGMLADLTGKNISEKLLDTVFGSFCVGK